MPLLNSTSKKSRLCYSLSTDLRYQWIALRCWTIAGWRHHRPINRHKLGRQHWLADRQTNACIAQSTDGAVQSCANDHIAFHDIRRRKYFMNNELCSRASERQRSIVTRSLSTAQRDQTIAQITSHLLSQLEHRYWWSNVKSKSHSQLLLISLW